jgi:hypothetical protein
MPLILFAVIDMPMPLPSSRMPTSASPFATGAGGGGGEIDVVATGRAVAAEVLDFVPELLENREEFFLGLEPAMVGGDRDLHCSASFVVVASASASLRVHVLQPLLQELLHLSGDC